HVPVLPAAVELVLLLVVLVNEVPGAAARRPIGLVRRWVDRSVEDPVAERELLVRAGTRRGVGRDVRADVERRVEEVARVGRRARVRERHGLGVALLLLRERV